MVQLGFMSQEDYGNSCAEITGGMYGSVDSYLLWFVRFFGYALIPKGLGLTQSKFYT